MKKLKEENLFGKEDLKKF